METKNDFMFFCVRVGDVVVSHRRERRPERCSRFSPPARREAKGSRENGSETSIYRKYAARRRRESLLRAAATHHKATMCRHRTSNSARFRQREARAREAKEKRYLIEFVCESHKFGPHSISIRRLAALPGANTTEREKNAKKLNVIFVHDLSLGSPPCNRSIAEIKRIIIFSIPFLNRPKLTSFPIQNVSTAAAAVEPSIEYRITICVDSLL